MQSTTSAVRAGAPVHVEGVDASAGGLVKATLGAAITGAAILTFIWLPAEYGIDPTGVGSVLGLTEMGEIKEQLHAEADADAAVALAAEAGQSVASNGDLNRRLDAIQAQLSAIAATVGAASASTQTNAQAVEPAPLVSGDQASAVEWLDENNYSLAPGEGIEIKLVMDEGAVADYEWTANGAVVNHDTHGDGSGQKISYEQGRSVPEQSGQLVAAFTGNHGWFWRNRTDDDVVVTLRTRGDYSELISP
ncbi:MAG: transmembrane anchor protein [Granulosicoccus sp.]